MPKTSVCCVVGCHNSPANTLGKNISFHRMPGKWYEKKRRDRWIQAIKRQKAGGLHDDRQLLKAKMGRPNKESKDEMRKLWRWQRSHKGGQTRTKHAKLIHDGTTWEPSKSTVICNEHFAGGMPSNIENHPAYLPTIFPSLYVKGPSEKRDVFCRASKILKQDSLPLTDESDAASSVKMSANEYYLPLNLEQIHASGGIQSEAQKKEVEAVCTDEIITESQSESEDFISPIEYKTVYKRKKTYKRCTAVDGKLLRKVVDAVEKLNDECYLFGEFIAHEMRSIRSPSLRMKFKTKVQKQILEITEKSRLKNA